MYFFQTLLHEGAPMEAGMPGRSKERRRAAGFKQSVRDTGSSFPLQLTVEQVDW